MAQRERDPERPDPGTPSRERVRETLIERRIRAAMEEGRFDGLPHQGRPLPLDDDALAGDRAMAHRMLKSAGYAPAWIEADKAAREELSALDDLLDRAASAGPIWRESLRRQVSARVENANRAITRLNAEAPTDRQHRRPVDLARVLERFDRAADRPDER